MRESWFRRRGPELGLPRRWLGGDGLPSARLGCRVGPGQANSTPASSFNHSFHSSNLACGLTRRFLHRFLCHNTCCCCSLQPVVLPRPLVLSSFLTLSGASSAAPPAPHHRHRQHRHCFHPPSPLPPPSPLFSSLSRQSRRPPSLHGQNRPTAYPAPARPCRHHRPCCCFPLPSAAWALWALAAAAARAQVPAQRRRAAAAAAAAAAGGGAGGGAGAGA